VLGDQLKSSHPPSFGESIRFWKITKYTIRMKKLVTVSLIFEESFGFLVSKDNKGRRHGSIISFLILEMEKLLNYTRLCYFVLFLGKVNFEEEECFGIHRNMMK
jgi:hypothetical protein